MRTVSSVSCLTAFLLGAMAWGVAATQPAATAIKTAATETPATVPIPGWGRGVDGKTLARYSGGSDVVASITVNGTVTNTSVDHVLTGSNVIGGDAFSGAAGLPMVIQNTGNGVLIQNATIVNVQFKP